MDIFGVHHIIDYCSIIAQLVVFNSLRNELFKWYAGLLEYQCVYCMPFSDVCWYSHVLVCRLASLTLLYKQNHTVNKFMPVHWHISMFMCWRVRALQSLVRWWVWRRRCFWLWLWHCPMLRSLLSRLQAVTHPSLCSGHMVLSLQADRKHLHNNTAAIPTEPLV